MTKNRSKMLIIFLSLILVVGLVASFISFKYPFSVGGVYYRYSSFVDELVLGADVNGGVVFEYQANMRENNANTADYDTLMDNTVLELGKILEDSGFKNSTIARQGENGIRVEVGGIINRDDSSEVTSLIGSPAQLSFSSTTSSKDAFMTGDYVQSVEAKEMAYGSTTVHFVEITFTDEGFNIMKAKSSEIVGKGQTFYMLLGEQQIGSSSEKVTTKSISMSSDNFIDKTTTEQYAIQIRTGLLPLELVCTYNASISPTGGFNTMLYIWVALAVCVIASIVMFIFKYKQIGLMASFNMLFYIVLGLFFLQSVPIVHINISGIFAIVVGYVLAVMGLVSTLESAKHEYSKGKKLHTCLKQGINNSLNSTISINVLFVLAGIICAFMPSMAIQSFGLVSLVLGFVNLFCSQVLMRLMIKLYLAINSYDGAKCNFAKEEGLKND